MPRRRLVRQPPSPDLVRAGLVEALFLRVAHPSDANLAACTNLARRWLDEHVQDVDAAWRAEVVRAAGVGVLPSFERLVDGLIPLVIEFARQEVPSISEHERPMYGSTVHFTVEEAAQVEVFLDALDRAAQEMIDDDCDRDCDACALGERCQGGCQADDTDEDTEDSWGEGPW